MESLIVLHTTKYGDSSLILHGYSLEHGRRSFILRGAAKKGRKGSANYLHPLAILEIEQSGSSASTGNSADNSLKHIKEYSPKYSLNNIRSNISKGSIAMYISELLYRTFLESNEDRELYIFLEKYIVTLDSLTDNFANSHIWFTIHFISLLGFEPKTGYRVLSEEFSNPFSLEERKLIECFKTSTLETCGSIIMTGEQRSSLLSTLINYLSYHLGINLNIRSINILQQILRG